MTELQYRSPIEFPEGWVRTAPNAAKIDQKFAQNISITEAVRYLQDEITALGAHKAVLHTNYDSLMNERQRSKRGHSEGVSLKLGLGDSEGFIACDKWYNVTQNLYAMHLAVRHFRLFEEWGIATPTFILDAFGSQSRSTSASRNRRSTDNSPEWMDILGLGATAKLEDANVIYRHKAKLVSEDEDALITLNHAIEEARKALRD